MTQKGSACQISADSEQLEKSQRNRYLRLPSTEPFIYVVLNLEVKGYPSLKLSGVHLYTTVDYPGIYLVHMPKGTGKTMIVWRGSVYQARRSDSSLSKLIISGMAQEEALRGL